jgi:hypothetical protein
MAWSIGVTGKYEQQVVTYVGDGTAGQVIPTRFPLDTGTVVIWIQGGVSIRNDAVLDPGVALDIGVAFCNGINCVPVSGNQVIGGGILGVSAAGFTVGDGNTAGIHYANHAGVKYAALVMRDTTNINAYLRSISYDGLGPFNKNMLVTELHPEASKPYCEVSGGFFPYESGLTYTDTTAGPTNGQHFIFQYIDANHGRLFPSEPSLGTYNFHYDGQRRVLAVGSPTIVDLSHGWIFGRSATYHSTNFAGEDSVALSFEAYQTNDAFLGFTPGDPDSPTDPTPPGLVVGTANNVNNPGNHYQAIALAVNPTPPGHRYYALPIPPGLFTGFHGTGSSVAGFGFRPKLAFARRFIGNSIQTGGVWRGPDHLGSHSSWMAKFSLSNDLVTGIVSLDADGITVGSELNAGDGYYGWAVLGDGEVINIPDPGPDPGATSCSTPLPIDPD